VYTITEVIHTSPRTKIYRGTRSDDGQSVVIKVLGAQHRPQHLERLKNEYEIGKALPVTAVFSELRAGLGSNAQLIIDVIPPVELVIGECQDSCRLKHHAA